jgi:undecaprenyl-diphosphatase
MYILLSQLINGSQIGINVWAFQAVKSMASPILNSLMSPLAESFFIVLPILALYMFFAKKDRNAYSFAVAAVILFIIGDILKQIFQEPRPCSVSDLSWINAIGCEGGYAFPSDHATVLTGLVLFLGKYKYIRILYVVWLVMILFGRVYLGAHYLTDVIAGVAISLVIAYIIYKFREKINSVLNAIMAKVIPPLAIKSKSDKNA